MVVGLNWFYWFLCFLNCSWIILWNSFSNFMMVCCCWYIIFYKYIDTDRTDEHNDRCYNGIYIILLFECVSMHHLKENDRNKKTKGSNPKRAFWWVRKMLKTARHRTNTNSKNSTSNNSLPCIRGIFFQKCTNSKSNYSHDTSQ